MDTRRCSVVSTHVNIIAVCLHFGGFRLQRDVDDSVPFDPHGK